MSTTATEKNTVFVVFQLVDGEGDDSTWKRLGKPVAAKNKKAAVEKKCADEEIVAVGQTFNVVPLSSWLEGDDLIRPQQKIHF